MRKKVFDRIGNTPKVIAIAITLVCNAFIWYFYAFDLLVNFVSEKFSEYTVIVLGLNFFCIMFAAIASGLIINRYKRRINFLIYWASIGIILSAIPLTFNVLSYEGLLIISGILGAYFGLGMPICMGYYAAITKIENRARLGGILFLFIGAGFALFSQIDESNIVVASAVLLIWRLIGVLSIIALKPEEKTVEQKTQVSYKAVLTDRATILYFVPWLLFLLVNNLTISIQAQAFDPALISYSGMIENVLAGIFAVIFGFIADSVGRKRLAITGFVLLGCGYGILAFIQNSSWAGWAFYTMADGIAWGAFYTIFLISIWGDLAKGKSSEKYYVLGSLPYLLSNFMRYFVGTYLSSSFTEFILVFSFASFFLFIAVLPLVYAPETLPEKVMKDNDLRSYIERAQRQAQKDANKARKKESKQPQKEIVEPPQEDKNYDEAKELAEKYY
jgi:Permeases of the major facilitator superfamily